jgi:hypothetical protein
MRVGQGTSGVLTAGAPRAGAQGVRASRAGQLAKGQRCAIRGYFFPEKSFFFTTTHQQRRNENKFRNLPKPNALTAPIQANNAVSVGP